MLETGWCAEQEQYCSFKQNYQPILRKRLPLIQPKHEFGLTGFSTDSLQYYGPQWMIESGLFLGRLRSPFKPIFERHTSFHEGQIEDGYRSDFKCHACHRVRFGMD